VIPLETERLTLRNFHPDDWQDFQEVIVAYQASASAKYEDPWPTSAEDIKNIITWFASGDDYLAVCLRSTGKIIGFVAINRRTEQAEDIYNLGYVFHPGYHGQGYATESCRATMAYLFDSLAADGILTGTRTENEASVRLLKRLGLKEIAPGEFALSREEWLAFSENRIKRESKR